MLRVRVGLHTDVIPELSPESRHELAMEYSEAVVCAVELFVDAARFNSCRLYVAIDVCLEYH